MTQHTVFVCEGQGATPGTAYNAVTGVDTPTCTHLKGTWTAIALPEAFDPSQLSTSELSQAWTAGFVVVGTGLVIVWAARMLINAIRSL